jgi:tRNA-dihydrouridine synthase
MTTLVPIFNRYPLVRIIVHPRTGIQMYDGQVDLQAFAHILEQIDHPVVYNGDIRDEVTFKRLQVRFPAVSGWMLGRGLIANPFLPEMIQNGSGTVTGHNQRFIRFHDKLVDGYERRFSGPGHVLDRMKGFWRYFADGFNNGPQLLKQIRKTKDLDSYRRIVSEAIAGQGKRWTDPELALRPADPF